MNASRDPDTILAAWLDEGPTFLPDVTRRAIVAALPTTTQRRRPLWTPWRFDSMSSPLRLAAAAVLAVAVLGVIYFNLPGAGDVGGQSPTPTLVPTVGPAASPSAAPTPTPAWQTITSERFGYSVDLPGDFVDVAPTDDLPDAFFPGAESDHADRYDAPVTHVPYVLVAVAVPEAPMTVAELNDAILAMLEADCDSGAPEAVTVDGIAGELRTVHCGAYDWFHVHVVNADRLFMIEWNEAPANLDAARPTFDQFLDSFTFAG